MPLPPPGGSGPLPDPLMSIPYALAVFGGILLFFTFLLVLTARRRRIAKGQWIFYALITVSMVGSFFEYTVRDFDARAFHRITATFGLHGTQLLVGVFVVAAGLGAHRFKQTSQLWYGYVEIVFGVVSSVLIVSRVNFAAVEFRNLSLAQCGTLVGAAYVVARGLNNVAEGKKSEAISSKAPASNPAAFRYPEGRPQSPLSPSPS